MKGWPRVSVVVPIWRDEPRLRQCLESLVDQDGIEVICVEDCRLIENAAIIADYAEHRRVRLIRRDQAGGYGQAVDIGMSQAHGIYIVIADPSCWYEPDAFEKMIRVAADTDVDVVMCGFTLHDPSRPEDKRRIPFAEPFYGDLELDMTNGGMRANGISMTVDLMQMPTWPFRVTQFPGLVAHQAAPWAMMCRRDFLIEHNIHMGNILGMAYYDFPFTTSVLCLAKSIVVLKENLAHWDFRQLTDEERPLGVMKSSQRAVTVMYRYKMTQAVGEALAAQIVVKNRAYYERAPECVKEPYGFKLKDLLTWMRCEGIRLDTENPYMSDFDREFVRMLIGT